MQNELSLYIPHFDELGPYRRMLADPATMAYNAPWFPPDGCITLTEAEWEEWYAKWIGQAPARFFAFLLRQADGAFVGTVNHHCNAERDWWDMGVVILAAERGRGYGRQGLSLLLDRAFRVDGVSRLHNDFESSRDAAFHIHKLCGFRELAPEDGLLQLMLTREEYFAAK